MNHLFGGRLTYLTGTSIFPSALEGRGEYAPWIDSRCLEDLPNRQKDTHRKSKNITLNTAAYSGCETLQRYGMKAILSSRTTCRSISRFTCKIVVHQDANTCCCCSSAPVPFLLLWMATCAFWMERNVNVSLKRLNKAMNVLSLKQYSPNNYLCATWWWQLASMAMRLSLQCGPSKTDLDLTLK